MKLDNHRFQALCRIVRETTGIELAEDRREFVESRLRNADPEMKTEMLRQLDGRRNETRRLPRRILESLLITETSFFRDASFFELLRTRVIPEFLRKRESDRRLRIWSAGCASGQEPYSLAMLLQDHFARELGAWDVNILGSDLSGEMIRRAREGRYSRIEIRRGLPVTCLLRYFDHDDAAWRIRPEIRSRVEFRELNLLEPWTGLPHMDIILLRNVLIYFPDSTRRVILEKIRRFIRQDGILLLGGAETQPPLKDLFERAPFGRMTAYVPGPGAPPVERRPER